MEYLKNLTKREKEIVVLIAKGQSSKLIASNLNISENTVKVHRKNILRKSSYHKMTKVIIDFMKQEMAKNLSLN